MALRLNQLFCFKVLLIVTGVFGLSQNALAHGEPCNPFMPKPCGDGEACLLKTVSPTYEGITYACHVMNIDYEVVDPEQDPEGIPLLLTFAMIPSPKRRRQTIVLVLISGASQLTLLVAECFEVLLGGSTTSKTSILLRINRSTN